MLWIGWTQLLVSVLLACNLCDARAATSHNNALLHPRQASGPNGGSCTKLPCGPKQCGGKRCLLGSSAVIAARPVEHLSKRAFQNPTIANLGAYLSGQALSPGAGQLTQEEEGFQDNTPTICLQYEFANLPRDRGSVIGMGDGDGNVELLTGCTVLTIVSARAVYMCHIWEFLHSSNVAPDPDITNHGIGPVLNFISGQPNHPDVTGNVLNPALFNGGSTDNTFVYIMTPRDTNDINNPLSQAHGAEIARLAAIVRSLIPGAAVVEYNYVPAEAYTQSFQGTALWEYDPSGLNNAHPD